MPPLIPFLAEVEHTDDVACCDSFLPAGSLIVTSPDGAAWHPDCARSAGYVIAEDEPAAVRCAVVVCGEPIEPLARSTSGWSHVAMALDGTHLAQPPAEYAPVRASFKGHGRPAGIVNYHGYHPSEVAAARLARVAVRGGMIEVVDAHTGEQVVWMGTASKFWLSPAVRPAVTLDDVECDEIGAHVENEQRENELLKAEVGEDVMYHGGGTPEQRAAWGAACENADDTLMEWGASMDAWADRHRIARMSYVSLIESAMFAELNDEDLMPAVVDDQAAADVDDEPTAEMIEVLRNANPMNGIVTVYVEARLSDEMVRRGLLWEDGDADLYLDAAGVEWLRAHPAPPAAAAVVDEPPARPCEGGPWCRCPKSTPCYPPAAAAAAGELAADGFTHLRRGEAGPDATRACGAVIGWRSGDPDAVDCPACLTLHEQAAAAELTDEMISGRPIVDAIGGRFI